MRTLIVTLAGTLLFACSGPGRPAPKRPDSAPANLDYAAFLQRLKPSDLGSVSRAEQQYVLLFAQQKEQARDSGYVLFERYYSVVDSVVNAQMENDGLDYERAVPGFNDGRVNNVPAALKARVALLKANGFRIEETEGIPFIEKDYAWVKERLYRYLSQPLRAYLEQLRKEYDEPYQEDAGLLVSGEELADRTIWWERFLNDHPKFPFRAQVAANRQEYLSALLTGMDNSPVYDSDSAQLSSQYASAWNRVLTRAPSSQAARVLRPYQAAWESRDTAQIGRLLRNYVQRGLIFSAEVQLPLE